ncbi:PREDICTED: 39S ribosomal protein L16, mitochondrial-like [Priapulus caudatus]|uniref:Large ribosomal subunit protein uL16m n=1 Tax=Priapulus caudatus TaxID=37621 RepID=A0ABM1DVN1_PRICU|nr:PREDICTED: 39S ribosomal protein L16, mitochondrial-like [Priapulus caudatus]
MGHLSLLPGNSDDGCSWCLLQVAGLKDYKIPPKFENIEFPERVKLKIMERVPQFRANEKPIKMMKNLKDLRGPEPANNKLIHKQYGIQALTPGNLRWGHLEMMRIMVNRNMDDKRMFAVWRIDPPWKPITKKGQGQRMGGGKGPIDHYVTPVRADRIVLEMGGNIEFAEVKPLLEGIVKKLPLKAWTVSQQLLDEKEAQDAFERESNNNPFTLEFLIKNNMQGCRQWMSKYDKMWYMKYK